MQRVQYPIGVQDWKISEAKATTTMRVECFLVFFFVVYLALVGAYGGINMQDIWLWFVFAGMPFDVRGGSSFFFACGVVPWAPLFATYLVFSSTHV